MRSADSKIITCPFDKHEIKVKLSVDDKFIEIVGMRCPTRCEAKTVSPGYHDVDEFYRD